ncbi:hypothetical protein BG011_002291 [Mortierella polycephala]|uniref:Galactose oxidase n=1 Tax=Mortierella polycephala TaxID=41804 RepID=A0A9P6U5B0_9FUNG|nr:hypothetical protein BG011_002291 [Mortierella polycephala]
MITFDSGATFAMQYTVETNVWTSVSISVLRETNKGIGAVTDRETGLVYLAGGYTGERNMMSVYDFGVNAMWSLSKLPDQALTFRSRAYYGNVWCQHRKSILYFGGFNAGYQPLLDDNVVTEYVPSTSTWMTLATRGTPPPMRADHCMASNDDGTQVIVYGGRLLRTMKYTNDLYILDTRTLVWRQGASGLVRAYAVCTIAGDQFLLWAGEGSSSSQPDTTVLIYDMKLNTWITDYTPPPSYVQARDIPQPTPGSSDPSSSSSHTGAIVGGVVGGLAVVLGLALLLNYTRRRKGNHGATLVETRGDDGDAELERARSPYSEETDRNSELQNLRAQIENHQEEIEVQRRLLEVQQQQQQQQHQQQQHQQQQQQRYSSPAYSYHPTLYTAAPSVLIPASHPYTAIDNVYTADVKAPVRAVSSSSTSFLGHSPAPTSPTLPTSPTSPAPYVAYPYQPTPAQQTLVPVVATTSNGYVTNAPSPVVSVSSLMDHAQASGSSPGSGTGGGNISGNQRGPSRPSGPTGNPQEGARER